MEAFYDGRVVLHPGDCLDALAKMPEGSVDSIVTDPPYHLTSIVERFGADGAAPATSGVYKRSSAGFMGKAWDGGDIAFRPETWAIAMRVLKPGGYLAAFGAPKNYHRLACAIEDAGFEIRDSLMWLFGSGFPKSHNVSKAIDRAAGVERVTDEAASAEGTGSALKPAFEPIVLARKPIVGTIAENFLAYGTGVLFINAARVPFDGADDEAETKGKNRHADFGSGPRENAIYGADKRDRGADGNYDAKGRWPANIVHDGSDEVLAAFPVDDKKASGRQKISAGGMNRTESGSLHTGSGMNVAGKVNVGIRDHGDAGSASRFFYCAKADAGDRVGSKHPTVKPVALMRWLVRMLTPPGGLTVDPFAGTGTTGEAAYREGMRAILMERDPEYQADIARRMELITAGPEHRRLVSAKARGKKAKPAPLFGEE